MKTIGFPMTHKENEYRRAILPCDLSNVRNRGSIYIEKGYGEVLGISDEEYEKLGCKIVSHLEVLNQDIICDAKIGDADYLEQLKRGQIIFGWIHAIRNKDITDSIIGSSLTAIAWEDMFKDNRHCFWRNNEIAGEGAIIHAFQCYGLMPYNAKVALIGRGNVASGALRILTLLGADLTIYDRKTEKLLIKELILNKFLGKRIISLQSLYTFSKSLITFSLIVFSLIFYRF